MKISYAITVCNEYEEIQKLLSTVLLHKRDDDEIVVLFDQKNGTANVWGYLRELEEQGYIRLEAEEFNNHFADWKNSLSNLCSGDYIFQIDADEYPDSVFLENIHQILTENKDNEVYYVPRVNTVEGLTQEHIEKWRWNVNEEGWVNWPDYQMRIWKNKPEISWKNKVHEVLQGYQTFSAIPAMKELALYHPKEIKRQEKQNKYYDTL
tara:strand:+ start:2420 stop:3043 length:624 start_codon:yes stop_codon:yes gene_type:complete